MSRLNKRPKGEKKRKKAFLSNTIFMFCLIIQLEKSIIGIKTALFFSAVRHSFELLYTPMKSLTNFALVENE